MSSTANDRSPIPTAEAVLSRDNYWFHPSDGHWKLSKDIKIAVGSVRELLPPSLHTGFTNTLSFYARDHSPHTVKNMSERMLHMMRSSPGADIDETLLINYRAILTESTAWQLGTIRSFLKKWHALGYAGVSRELIDAIMKWTIPGNEKGDAVKRLDPNEGPLSAIELLAFNEGAVQAFEKGRITLRDLSISLCISNIARRSIQLSHLRIIDLSEKQSSHGLKRYFLNIPRAKQKGVTFRSEFRRVETTKELFMILRRQSEFVRQQVELLLKIELPPSLANELPLFPNSTAVSEISSLEELVRMQDTDYFHMRSSAVTETVKKVAKKANVVSHRTGEKIELSARRFRYTLGTRAAREGFGVLIIAELLDHSDTQNAGVYTQNVPENAKRLDEAMAHQLAPLAKAFAGTLVDSERGALRGSDPRSRIKRDAKNAMGSCGTFSFCGANAPIPCYTCIHFQPWVDGPHELLLHDLLAEREIIANTTNDLTVAAALDRTILAVTEVIQKCAVRRAELADG